MSEGVWPYLGYVGLLGKYCPTTRVRHKQYKFIPYLTFSHIASCQKNIFWNKCFACGNFHRIKLISPSS